MEEMEEVGMLGAQIVFLMFVSERLYFKHPSDIMTCLVSSSFSAVVFLKKLIRLYRARFIAKDSLLVFIQTVSHTIMIMSIFADCQSPAGCNMYIFPVLALFLMEFAILLRIVKAKYLSRNDLEKYTKFVNESRLPPVQSVEEWVNLLAKIIKCSVCKEVLSPFAAICEKGHAVCLECKTTDCLHCDSPFQKLTSNSVFHQILAFFDSTYCKPCSKVRKLNHECAEKRLEKCRMCDWTGTKRQLVKHMREHTKDD
uniref:Uncharacterized protein n=1 Tax=Homalodisca liturata TaxID=320908 RepID=A0A1B6JRB6_9HEMI